MQLLSELIGILIKWVEEYRKHVQLKKEQTERDLSESDPNAWFDDQFNPDGRVHKHNADGTRQTNVD